MHRGRVARGRAARLVFAQVATERAAAIVIGGIAQGRAAAIIVVGAARVRGRIAGAARERATVLATLAHDPAVLAYSVPGQSESRVGRVGGSRRSAA